MHALEHAGTSVADKLAAVRRETAAAGADTLLLNDLAEIAWLFNLRGADVDCNPVFVAYAAVAADGATLYIHKGQVGDAVAAHLAEAGVAVAEYAEVRARMLWSRFYAAACRGRRRRRRVRRGVLVAACFGRFFVGLRVWQARSWAFCHPFESRAPPGCRLAHLCSCLVRGAACVLIRGERRDCHSAGLCAYHSFSLLP